MRSPLPIRHAADRLLEAAQELRGKDLGCVCISETLVGSHEAQSVPTLIWISSIVTGDLAEMACVSMGGM